MNKKTTLQTGNMLLQGSSKKTPDAKMLDKISNIFSPSKNSEPVDERSERKDQKERELSEIRDKSWETVEKIEKDRTIMDSKAIRNNSGMENTERYDSFSSVPSGKSSILDPEAFNKLQNDEYSQHIIDAGKERRRKEAERGRRDRDFEPSRATTTADTNPFFMGFTPMRSALKQDPLVGSQDPIKEVEEVKAKAMNAKIAGEKAAKLKTKLDNVFANKFREEANDDRAWQDRMGDEIENRLKNVKAQKNKTPRVADDFTKVPDKSSMDLSGVFKNPYAQFENEEKDIKRDSSSIKSKRAKREDDRTWETLENLKSRKY